ncbi:MAG: hypothetical protein Q8P18_09225 [Pseudomonadota bacterium]|nr:hypothetical protein [Pseudomonadota bacterium]
MPSSLLLAVVTRIAFAASPVLGPTGWTWLGPLPPESGAVGDGTSRDSPRDTVVFDPSTCAVDVSRVDLDGGPGHRDVRLARVWTGEAWRWADDWEVRDGRLLRPGQAPVPFTPGGRVGGEAVTLDAAGRVVSRRREGRLVEVLRDEGGGFRGMRSGTVEVRLAADDPSRAVASDGRAARWRWEGAELRSVADAGGVRSLYTYADGRLSTVGWADGGRISIEPGDERTRLHGTGGTWTCARRVAGTEGSAQGRVSIESPAGTWTLEQVGEIRSVTDPAGGTTRTRWAEGRLAGWTDPRGGETRLERDPQGRVTSATDPSGARWETAWQQGGGLGGVVAPDGARWVIGRDATGAVTRVDEPSGRSAEWERDAAGRPRGVRVGASRWGLTRDASGRIIALSDPAGVRLDLSRDASGAVIQIRDAAGGAWSLTRDGRGRVVSVTDPGAARWEVVQDSLGRPVAVRDPTGAWARWTRRDTGAPERITLGEDTWGLLWNAAGALAGLRDPQGQTTGWARDPLGRARAVHRADGSVVRLDRDGAGDLVGVDDVRVRRDAAGRPLAVEQGASGLYWDLDAAGYVVGVTAPGVGLGLVRERGGAIREVRVAGSSPVRLQRDAQGRVVRAEDDTAVDLTRDASGRVTGVAREGSPRLRIERDMRGLPARFVLGDRVWTVGRDAPGRIVTMDAPGAIRLGIDRDVGGRPGLVRFATGALARFERSDEGVAITLTDRDGAVLARAGAMVGRTGLLGRLDAAATWLFRRDPLDTLVAVESATEVWSSAPDGVEGPDGAYVRYDAAGRPRAARAPAGWGAWGTRDEPLDYVLDQHGAIRAIGATAFGYDGIGRLVGWDGPGGSGSVLRDPLGRLARLGGAQVEGWGGLLTVGGEVRAEVPGIAVARLGGGVLLDPRGTPLMTIPGGLVSSAPTGALRGRSPQAEGTRESGAAGRLQVAGDGALLGLVDALDPLSGQPLGPWMTWPWAPRTWEAGPSASPLVEADTSATGLPWDPMPWAATSPWSDPLALLVAAGELPDGGARARSVAGLPWLPASLVSARPAPVPDPLASPFDEEPIVAWILAHAGAPSRAAAPESLTAAILGADIATWLRTAPGLTPSLPAALRVE